MIVTSYTLIDAFPFEVVVFAFATKRWFGAFSPGNLELLRGKHPAPFFITSYNFISHIQLLLLGRLKPQDHAGNPKSKAKTPNCFRKNLRPDRLSEPGDGDFITISFPPWWIIDLCSLFV
jgi:hypothetical protein